MVKLEASLVFGAIVCVAVVADAAPSTGRVTETPAPAPSINVGAIAKALTVVGEIVPQAGKCGETLRGRVKLTNKTTKPWQGVVMFLSPQQKTASVSLAASGDESVKTVEVEGAKLDCKKPLSPVTVKAFPLGYPSNVVVERTMKPKTIHAEVGFNMPPPTETKVWLRRATLNATCGGLVSATAIVQGAGTASQDATLKLGFGQYVSTVTVTAPPNQPTTAAMPIPTPLDCQGGAGIPAFEYTLVNGAGGAGKLEAQEITYE